MLAFALIKRSGGKHLFITNNLSKSANDYVKNVEKIVIRKKKSGVVGREVRDIQGAKGECCEI